jgi:hypothetical protein
VVLLPEFPCCGASLGIATPSPVAVGPGAPLLVSVVLVELPVVEVPVPEVVVEVSVDVPVAVVVVVVVPASVDVLVDDGGVVLVEGLEPGRVESGPAKSFAIAVLNWKLGLYSQDKRFDMNCRQMRMRGKRTPGTQYAHAGTAIPLGSVPGYTPCDGWVTFPQHSLLYDIQL